MFIYIRQENFIFNNLWCSNYKKNFKRKNFRFTIFFNRINRCLKFWKTKMSWDMWNLWSKKIVHYFFISCPQCVCFFMYNHSLKQERSESFVIICFPALILFVWFFLSIIIAWNRKVRKLWYLCNDLCTWTWKL